MGCLGNLLWLLFGGLATAFEYFTAGLVLCLTVVGIPWGLQAFKLGVLALWPFGSHVEEVPGSGGCLDTLMNVIWFFIGGFYIFLTHVFFGCLLYITIVGIPWGQMSFRLARLALWPFGKRVV